MNEMQRGEATRAAISGVKPYTEFNRPTMAVPGNEDVPDLSQGMVTERTNLPLPQYMRNLGEAVMYHNPELGLGFYERADEREQKQRENIMLTPGQLSGAEPLPSMPIKYGKDYITKPETPAVHTAGGGLYRTTPGKPGAEQLVAPQPPKAPPGYRYNAQGEQEMIPGGPADTKHQIKYATDEGRVRGVTNNLAVLKTKAEALKKHPGLGGITGIKGKFPNIPGGTAANAQAQLDQLKSRIGLDTLQNMRMLSPTGGALGNVSDAEGVRLERYIAALDQAQSKEAMEAALDDIIKYADDAGKNIQTTFERSYSDSGKRSGVSKEDAMAELRRRKVIP